ncbi:MAG: hypothetical protein ACLUEQ_01350 [Cloacibacillus evryensis]
MPPPGRRGGDASGGELALRGLYRAVTECFSASGWGDRLPSGLPSLACWRRRAERSPGPPTR